MNLDTHPIAPPADQFDRGSMARTAGRDLQRDEARGRGSRGWRVMRDSMCAGLCHAAIGRDGNAGTTTLVLVADSLLESVVVETRGSCGRLQPIDSRYGYGLLPQRVWDPLASAAALSLAPSAS
jgi:hypothetical protein